MSYSSFEKELSLRPNLKKRNNLQIFILTTNYSKKYSKDLKIRLPNSNNEIENVKEKIKQNSVNLWSSA